MSTKKKVTFQRYDGKAEVYGMPGVEIAFLSGVKGHYRLGDQDRVRTSAVIRIEGNAQDPDLIETLNTIYVRDRGDGNKALRCAC